MSEKYIYTHEKDEYPDWWDGRAIMCKAWDEKIIAEQVEIIGIDVDSPSRFFDSLGGFWPHAEPVLEKQTVRKYLDPVSMMQWLVDHGYEPCAEGWDSPKDLIFNNIMWQYCGKPVGTFGSDRWNWLDEWIEEVEE
jgi:hypothetical protein